MKLLTGMELLVETEELANIGGQRSDDDEIVEISTQSAEDAELMFQAAVVELMREAYERRNWEYLREIFDMYGYSGFLTEPLEKVFHAGCMTNYTILVEISLRNYQPSANVVEMMFLHACSVNNLELADLLYDTGERFSQRYINIAFEVAVKNNRFGIVHLLLERFGSEFFYKIVVEDAYRSTQISDSESLLLPLLRLYFEYLN